MAIDQKLQTTRIEEAEDKQEEISSPSSITGHLEKDNKPEFKAKFTGALPPKSMTPEQQAAIKTSVQKLIRELGEADGSKEVELADRIGGTGAKKQKLASDNFKQNQITIGRLVEAEAKEGGNKEYQESISNLQDNLRKVHPKYVEREAWVRFIKMIPIFGNWMTETLKRIAKRQQSIGSFMQEWEESLRNQQERLRMNYATAKVVLGNLDQDRETIKSEAYLAEIFWEQLEDLIRETKDPEKKAFLEDVLDEVVGRAQDLRVMDEGYAQFKQTLLIHRKTTRLTIKAMDRMIEMGLNLAGLAFLVYAMLMDEKNALELVQNSRTFIGEQLRQNSILLRKNIAMLGDILKNPMAPMKAIEESHNNIMQAITDYDRVRAESRVAARENIGKIKLMTEELDTKVRAPEKEQSLGIDDLLPIRPAGGVERPKI